MEKKYNLIYQLRLETYVKVNGDMVPISFTGGRISHRGRKNGFYITANEDIQKALESDTSYGKQWILDKESAERAEKEKKVKAETPVVDPPVVNPPVVNPPKEDNPAGDPPAGNEGGEDANPGGDATGGAEDKKETVDTELAECTNYTLAKNYLMAKFPETKRPDIISEEKLREYAKSKGITFPEFTK